MVSGFFDPLHDIHLDYLEAVRKLGDLIICLVASDNQVLQKKGKVNIPEHGRLEIMDLILAGMGVKHLVMINRWDKDRLIAEALRHLKPDILCRGGDKELDDMPPQEHKVCEELDIEIVHVKLKEERHGSQMQLERTVV